jgi:hypothetical protein
MKIGRSDHQIMFIQDIYQQDRDTPYSIRFNRLKKPIPDSTDADIKLYTKYLITHTKSWAAQ